MIDSYYTPPILAGRLVSHISTTNVISVADFCIGEGELVKAALLSFPNADVYGTDISKDVIVKLKRCQMDWHLAACDFTDEDAVASVGFLKSRKLDLIVLNPPFTCKGSIAQTLKFDDKTFKVSTAMLFFMKALNFLSERGGVYAILPISCVHSNKDKEAWQYLCNQYNACILEEPERVYFSKKCSPNIVLVYAGRYKIKGIDVSARNCFEDLKVTDIIRGAIRMQGLKYKKTEDAIPLVHTTNMQDGRLIGLKKIIGGKSVKGPGVLIPRVCNPNKSKIVLLDDNNEVILSDCVVFLKTDTIEDAIELRNYIINRWDDFSSLYKGTGARYTTIERLCKAFGLEYVKK